MTGRARIGCYPGSFDPPTVAHLAVAEAAAHVGGLDRVDLVVSRRALGKEAPAAPAFEDRVTLLGEVAAAHPWLGVVVTEARLLSEVASGYDAVVMGADKWRQIHELRWYEGSVAARDQALAKLPHALVAPRDADDLVDLGDLGAVTILPIDPDHRQVSSTAIRTAASNDHPWLARPTSATLGEQTDPDERRP